MAPVSLLPPDHPRKGKALRNMAAPWILLTRLRDRSMHAYEIGKRPDDAFSGIGIGLNLRGIFRHLKQVESRGIVVSTGGTKA